MRRRKVPSPNPVVYEPWSGDDLVTYKDWSGDVRLGKLIGVTTDSGGHRVVVLYQDDNGPGLGWSTIRQLPVDRVEEVS